MMLIFVAALIAVTLNASLSPAAIEVVQPVSVAECRQLFDAMAGVAEAVIEAVGSPVPVAILNTSTVAGPVSTHKSHAEMVPANGTAAM